MLDRLRQVVEEYEALEHQLADPDVIADHHRLREASKRYNELGPVVAAYRRYAARAGDAEVLLRRLQVQPGGQLARDVAGRRRRRRRRGPTGREPSGLTFEPVM